LDIFHYLGCILYKPTWCFESLLYSRLQVVGCHYTDRFAITFFTLILVATARIKPWTFLIPRFYANRWTRRSTVVCYTLGYFLFRSMESHMDLNSVTGWLMTWSVVLTNSDSFIFLVILSTSLHCIPWSSSQQCFATLHLDLLVTFCAAFMLGDSGAKWPSCLSWIFISVFASDAVSCTSIFGLLYKSMLRSVVRDLKAVRNQNFHRFCEFFPISPGCTELPRYVSWFLFLALGADFVYEFWFVPIPY
jgi:hypothetical protein